MSTWENGPSFSVKHHVSVTQLEKGEEECSTLEKGFRENFSLEENERFYSESYNFEGDFNFNTTRHEYPLKPYAPDCPHYLKTGYCKFGYLCKFNHPLRRASQVTPHSSFCCDFHVWGFLIVEKYFIKENSQFVVCL